MMRQYEKEMGRPSQKVQLNIKDICNCDSVEGQPAIVVVQLFSFQRHS